MIIIRYCPPRLNKIFGNYFLVLGKCGITPHRLYRGSLTLRILTGKKHRQTKLQRLQKVQIWAFSLLAQQLNSL